MVQMGMRENDGCNAIGRYRKWRPVPQAQFLQTLTQTAVDKKSVIAVLNEKLRSSDGASTPKERKCYTHRHGEKAHELTALISFQNLSSKFNSALGVPPQGFCQIPEKSEAAPA